MTNLVPGQWQRLRGLLPHGQQLPRASWDARHRFIVWTAFLHAPLLAVFGLAKGWSPAYWIAEPMLVGGLAWVASRKELSRRMRSGIAALALVTSSAILVQFSGGFIEAHFHYFIVVALVALYEDFTPFLLAIAYVALHHGLVGSLLPEWVYNHAGAADEPWRWAGIHALAILGESVALLAFWAGAQQVRDRSDVVLESTGEGMLGTDLDGRITFANPAAARLLGTRAESLTGQMLRDVVPEASRRPGAPASGVLVGHVPMTGTDLLIEWNSSPTQRNGVALGAVVSLRDVTGRRLLEEQVLAHARQNAAIARLGQAALEARDLDALLHECTRQVAATLGTELCKVLELEPGGDRLRLRAGVGWSPGLIGSATVPAGLDSQAGYTLASSQPVVVPDLAQEQRFRGPALLTDHGVVSGLSVTILASRRPWGVLGAHTRTPRGFTSDDVNFVQAVANLLASSIERHNAEQGLRTRNRQQAIVASLGHEALSGERLDAFLGRCAREVAAGLDVEFCKVLELTRDGEALLLRAGHGWRPGLVGHALVPADLHSQAGYALRHDGPVIVRDLAVETRFTQPALLQEHGVVSGISVLIKGPDRPFGVLGAHSTRLRDFTHDDLHFLQAVANLVATAIERRAVEEELLQHRLNLEGLVESRTAQLREANHELEAFSYTVSHDLRTPLRSIDGFTQILRRRYGEGLPPDAHELLDRVHDGAIRMGNLIESVLTLSRVSRKPLARERVDLSAIAAETLRGRASADPDRAVAWEVEPGLQAVGDEGLLRLALENLLGNAWKFTSQTPQARIAFRREPSRPDTFVVEDNGAGFDMVEAGELFQPFHRLHDPRQFPGTGIGLATVSRIVQRHGGSVWAESARGQGARFFLSLPSRPPDGSTVAVRPSRPLVEVREAGEARRRQG